MDIRTLFLLVVALSSVYCYNILVVFPLPGRSHSILGKAFVNELLKKGHTVSHITPFPTNKPTKGLTEIDLSFVNVMREDRDTEKALMAREAMSLEFIQEFARQGSLMVLEHESIQKLLKDRSQKFDLVIAEWFFSELYSGFGAVLQCPYVVSSSMYLHSHLENLIDEVSSPAIEPYVLGSVKPPLPFWARLQNSYDIIKAIVKANYVDYPAEAAIYKKIFGPAATSRGIQLPDYVEVISNTSLVLLNSHPSLLSAKRLPANAIEIGGYHVDDSPPNLTPELKKILDEAKHGVIYFSLGSNIKSKDLPVATRDALLEMFKSLKQTVLWKFEDDLPNLPSNVHIQKWMPQQSILAHPNIKLFITHGGLLSTTEAVHCGVPLIGIPFFGDQFLNMATVVNKGYGLQAKMYDPLFVNILKQSIETILTQPSYTETAKYLSKIYHDRPVKPKDLAVYWIEYVVRTGGATHLRSVALRVPFYQRYLLDFIALFATIVFVTYTVVKRVLCKLFKKSKTKVD